MNRPRTPITGLGLAILLAACGSGGNNGTSPQGSGGTASGAAGSGSSSSTANPGGGSTANPGGGSTVKPGGGTTANPGGGTTANPGGGTAVNPGGGSTANPGGGTAVNPGGGTAVNPGGGTAVNPGGGTAVNPGGGTTGGGAGKTSTTGGAPGGAPGTGGSTGTTGGTTSTGGSTATTPSTACITSASGAYWKTATCTDSTASADVTVNDASASQTWEGFGGAFNELGWSFLTTKALQDEAMQLLFGVDGAHFNWGRIPIGASDYARDRYTDDETANDTSMAGFSITRDQKDLIPFIKAAKAVRSDLKFWASPWTPPTWMKSSPYLSPGNPVNAFDGGTMKSDTAILNAYAQYLIKWIQAYGQQDINIEVISAQNEPGFQQNYPSCLWDKTNYVNFIKILGPALTSASLTTKVMLGTMSNGAAGKDGDIATAVMADTTAKGIVKVMGAQWEVLDKVVAGTSYGLPIWASEHKCGNYPWNPSGSPKYVEPAPNDQAYGVESWGYIRDAIKKGGVTAYNAWNMVLDKMGYGIDNTRKWAQDALLVVDGGKITQTPAYYVFRHFSQFVDPGAKVVGTSGGDAVAFKNPDGTIVAVMFATSAKTTYTVSIAGKKLQFAMPANGWATVKTK
jgi:glucosylceramidase